MKQLIAILCMTTIILGLFAGCAAPANSKPADSKSAQAEPLSEVELTMELWGDKPNQMDEILEEFHKRTKDTLNIKLSINWTPMEEYIQKINLKLSAGEDVDFCFDAPWQNMTALVAQDVYRDLTPYFNNPEYPGLQKCFSGDIYVNNLFDGKMMGLPITQSYGGGSITFLRGDLRKKYGMEPIKTLEDFETYLQKVKENEPNMIPFVMSKTGDFGAASLIQMNDPEITLDPVRKGVWPVSNLAPQVDAQFYIKDYKVVDCVLSSVEPATALANFPAPYNAPQTETAKKTRAWYDKGWLEKDLITRDDAPGTFTAGKAASLMWTDSQYNMVNSNLAASVPGAEIEFYVHDRLTRDKMKGLTQGNFRAWNFVCVPVTTSDEKFERIMKFLDWVYASAENHDLFEYGIDGKNFISVGDDQYSYPEGMDLATNYNFPWYQLSGNPAYVRFQSGLPEPLVEEIRYVFDPESYYNPLVSGFSFNQEPVKMELSNPDLVTLYTERKSILSLAQSADVDAALAKLDQKYNALPTLQQDVAAIKKEAITQMNAYLADRKIKDAENGTTYPN